MVRRVLIGVALLLAGCQSDGALDIVVPAMPGVTRVRLYIGVGDGTPDAIAPQGFQQYVAPNRWWPLDPAASTDVRDVGDASEVVFELARGDNGENVVHVAIAVGFDDAGRILGAAELRMAAIPTDYIARHTVALSDQVLATTWPAGDDTCVAIANTALRRAEMVVDPADPDCDGFTSSTDECDPYFYKSQGTVRLEDTSCVVATTAIASGQTVATCQLGGPTCIDGGTTGGDCAPSPYCVPHSACESCAYQLSCLYDIGSTTFLGAHVQCNVGLDPNGQLCTTDFVLDLDGVWPGLPACNTDEQLTKDGTYAGDVRFPTPGSEIRIGVQNPTSACSFALRSEGPLPVGESVSALIAGSFVNGRGWAMPVKVTAMSGGCDSPEAGCHLENVSSTDQFVACVTAMSP